MELCFVYAFINLFSIFNSISGEAVQLTSHNFDRYVLSHELVYLNFYADWCKFSQILAPIFNEAADRITKEVQEPGKILFGKVDCDTETNIATRFHITKYPTLKLLRNGKLMKREYRGQRSVDAITEFIRDLLKDPVVEIKEQSDFDNIKESTGAGILYLSSRAHRQYEVFRKVAMDLRDDCQFFVVTGDLAKTGPKDEGSIIFKPARSKLGENNEIYLGVLLSYDELSDWMTNRCIPLIREINFENAEELTEEGLPFLILFHDPEDKESVKKFTKEVRSQLLGDKSSINFVTSDGHKFSHPLHHLGKTQKDLPVIAIDSFRHMYLFPEFNDISVPGKLKQFVEDFYSGKLHREFHYGPEVTTSSQSDSSPANGQGERQKVQTHLPESTFRKLAPSRNRYTILHDEL
ncbi:endoplasmic reticulum resident protein 44-like [Limulus polyphemus]|uniref:Endoplasmic reticulum resident protein 44-like n=1 Tax=Limulus polyphemus TaxID=6850 RepID=A0ABM1BJ86_LIMPO|nr:endoplasmic reticulum resident protein 44-like [Limulus polyphemus]